MDKFKVTVPKIGDPEIVKPFTPPLETSVGMTVRQPAMKKSKTKPKKTCKPSKLFEDDEITECMTRWYFQAVTLDELRRLLYPREIAMKELNPTKGCKSSRIHEDDDTLPEEFTLEEMQAMSLEMIRKLLYPRTIIMEELECQTDNVKSDTSDKKSQDQDTSADPTKIPMTSEKKSCKLLACMATPKKQSRVTSIDSVSGSPKDYQSASKQNDGEQEYNSK